MHLPLLLCLTFGTKFVLGYNYDIDPDCKPFDKEGTIIQGIVNDAAILADYATIFPLFPTNIGSPAVKKEREPLAANLFGSLTLLQYSLVNNVLWAAERFAHERANKNVKPLFSLKCKQWDEKDLAPNENPRWCEDDAIMQTRKAENNYQHGEWIVAICPAFWTQYQKKNLWHLRLDDKVDELCSFKPVNLAANYAGRLLYHETIHFLKFDADVYLDVQDYGYGIDKDSALGIMPDKLITQIDSTTNSIANPDTYSFLALLAYRRSICRWPKTGSYYKPDFKWDFPMTTVPKSVLVKEPSIYGDNTNIECPKQETQATIDTIPFATPSGSKQVFGEVLWCKLIDQRGKCPAPWDTATLDILNGQKKDQLKGCFKTPVSSQEFARGSMNVTDQSVIEDL